MDKSAKLVRLNITFMAIASSEDGENDFPVFLFSPSVQNIFSCDIWSYFLFKCARPDGITKKKLPKRL